MINQIHLGKIKLSKKKIYGKDLRRNPEKYLDGVQEALIKETMAAVDIYGDDAVFFKIEKYTNCSAKIVERIKLVLEDMAKNETIIIPAKDPDGDGEVLYILNLE